MNIILRNLYIITPDLDSASNSEDYYKVVKGDIGIVDDKIICVGKIPSEFKATKDMEFDYNFERIAMPGLINTHTHMAMGFFRNYSDGLPILRWLEECIWPAEARLTPDDIYYGTLLGISELIKCGCTTFRDMYFELDKTVEATVKSGLRAVLGRGMVGIDDPNMDKLKDSVEKFEKYNNSGDGRVKIEIAPHAPYTCTAEYLKASYKAAKELGCTYHIHVSESAEEVKNSLNNHKMTPMAWLEHLGVLSNIVGAAHCVHVTDEEIEIMARRGVSMLHNPSSNLKLGNGFAPIRKFLDAGINITLGTDGASSNNNLNMFEELHLMALIHKGVEQDPTFLTPDQLIQIATINGAKSLQLENVGHILPDYKADIILLKTTQPHMIPINNIKASVVYSAQGSDVTDTMVDGKFLMQNGEITVFEEHDLYQEIEKIVPRLINKEV